MRKWIDGQYADMTAEEIAASQTPPEVSTAAPPSTEERLEALEAALLELICGGGE